MNNKTYLIIGGTGGIGQAMVKQLVQESAADQTDGASAKRHSTQVFATYHRSEPNFEAENLHWIPMNISDEDSIQKSGRHHQADNGSCRLGNQLRGITPYQDGAARKGLEAD
ncbi:hypothetical protein PKHYL_20690 [Psychrobacter sp. KH172YL61]|uniref:KR domain-containing protein n=1 Tax=Psychrobacter sp. KH172YL61 TaxID=2517899 RepID=UPI0010B2F6FF|nr:KR domain-containing protein [Psychrobacter sp. KH172YL61]BBI67878.1 hypothetical protein PKHYL_20690 [Psychrobacter sp. KH172YL61]